MTLEQINTARAWLIANRPTRIRPRLSGSIVRYVPRNGWGTGLAGVMDGAPAMWSSIDGPDAMDNLFRELDIPVDQPL